MSPEPALHSKTDKNPKDVDGPGFNDEKGDVPGEQAGNELDVTAENRMRDSDGRFI